MKIPKLSKERAEELLDYSPETGSFIWKVSQGKAKKGDAPGIVQHGYLKFTIDKEQIRSHRLAWFLMNGVWPKGQIDHIDGNKLNNSIKNLRDVPMSINMQNRYAIKRKNSDMPMGVSLTPSGKFSANIRLGVYDTKEEAQDAYMKAKRAFHIGCSR